MWTLGLWLLTAPAVAADVTSDDAKALLAGAIERGAPLYNDGSAQGCAAVYEVAAVALLRFGAEELSQADQQLLTQTLTGLPPDADGRAWALRRSFDVVLGMAPRPSNQPPAAAAGPITLPVDGAWNEVDDRVMGGISQGSPRVDANGHLVWTGTMTTESNGGFVTARVDFDPLDLRNTKGLSLRVRGDGRTYKVTLNTDRSHGRGIGTALVPTKAGQWTEVYLPYTAFTGRMYGGTKRLDKSRVYSLQLQLTGADQVGDYRVELASVRAVTAQPGSN